MALPPSVKPVLRAGAVFQYAYLWRREFLAGQPEARKDRPALAMAVAICDKDGRSHVMALPVTHSAPQNPDHGVQLPPATKRLLGLDDAPSWVITTEAVRFAWPGLDVRQAPNRTSPIYGFVSSQLLKSIVQSYLRNRQFGDAVSFDRYD
jgi:glycerol-3-phosphate O-acyltransferase